MRLSARKKKLKFCYRGRLSLVQVNCKPFHSVFRDGKHRFRNCLYTRLDRLWEVALSRPVSQEILREESIDVVARDIQYGLEQAPQYALSVTIVNPHLGLMEFRILQLSERSTSIQLSHGQGACAAFLYQHRQTLSATLSHQMNIDVRVDVCSYLI